ncbi:PREDICTED: gamma-glutamylaminecyclotransferase [Miniopterus natalensis]|uniref:gamma-glutamylaminecyclotransferase n=1 Tax=Miniopterus natalensis TaxID=291302 RepID=UPI0007A6F99C|nr:PREDICTED: gamma-glutamylaminecyclotransferase [Miniopterus natalensis]
MSWCPVWKDSEVKSFSDSDFLWFWIPGSRGIEETSSQSLARMAEVFVYGTLKQGQPNHKVLLDRTNGSATFQGRGHTVEPYPLVIAGEHNIPHMLNLSGRGHCVVGEIYAVDEQMLRFLDEFEGCPDMYQRTQVRVAVLEWEDSEEPPAAERTLQCFVYTTANYPPEWVQLPYLDNYDSEGAHGLRYNPRENR